MSLQKYLDNLEDLSNKKVLITGGTSGIGLSIVDQLLYKHAEVVVLARNPSKSKEVKNKMQEKYPDCHLDFISYDQSDFKSIETAIGEILKEHNDFYALILNAGCFTTYKTQKVDNDMSLTIKTNFVGLAYFLDILIPNLNNKHRIIFQGSLAAGYYFKKPDDLYKYKASSFQQYCMSKAGVEEIYNHYRSLGLEHLSFYLVEPGLTSTDILRDFPFPIKQLGTLFLKVASHSVRKASLTAMLALQENIHPCYIVPRSPFTWRGYPKIKPFPKKRNRPYLYNLVEEVIKKGN